MKGIAECSKCGKVAWKERGTKFYRCSEGHRTGNKYGAKRPAADALTVDQALIKRFGHFDSRLELQYWTEYLGWLEKAGEATEVKHHTIIELVPGMTYETDWDYKDRNGVYRIADTKGVSGERFKAIVNLWPIFGPAPLDIVKKTGNRWHTQTIPCGKWDGRRGPTGAWVWRKVA